MADQDPSFQIQRVYLKEASLEQPNSPAILLEQEQPSVDIQLGVEANPVAEGVYEVCVTATVQTKIKDKTVFLVEAKQAGIFEIRNLPEDQMGPIMGIACPQIVYPYLRGNVADLIQRGGFPFQQTLEPTPAESENPWLLLNRDLGPNIIPAIGDFNSTQWILHKSLGEDVIIENDAGEKLALRLVGLLQGSVFQGELLIAEDRFT